MAPVSSSDALEDRIINALVFFDLFDYPLTLGELEYYLPGEKAPKTELQNILNDDDRIRHIEGYYFLKDRAEIVSLRENRTVIAQKYWKKVRRFLPLIQCIPYVRMVAVCNTLAFNSPTSESDIDLFIVTKRGKLFLARTLVTILFSLLGVRRHGNKIAGRFCLSFFVSEDALNLQTIHNSPHDVYLPYWMLSLKPLYGQRTYKQFIAANTWFHDYFPGRIFTEDALFWKQNIFFRAIARMKELILNVGIGTLLENSIKKMQMKRHHKNLKHLGPEASVVVNEKMLKFHNVDRRNEFTERFLKNCQKFNALPFF